MRMLLMSHGSHGDVDPPAALTVRPRGLGAAARMAAVVRHGGAGTAVEAARSGAPRVVVPRGVDQPYQPYQPYRAGRVGRVAPLGTGGGEPAATA